MNLLWAVKTRRAQTVEDNESWAMGGVVPTLNVFDNAHETRATVIVFYGNRVDDIRIQDDKINTLQARMGTGGNNMPMVYQEGEDEQSFVPQTFDTYNQTTSDTAQTLRAGTDMDKMGVVYMDQPMVMQDREGKPGGGKGPLVSDTSFALRTSNFQTLFTPAEVEVMPTLLAGMSHLTGTTQDGYIEKVHKMISTVRRLTPTECERLQGFPDGWTEGQADSHRYKQLGNAVAVPVVEWLIGRLKDSATSMESSTE
jgi:site-specific DNA-cytosine methylase